MRSSCRFRINGCRHRLMANAPRYISRDAASLGEFDSRVAQDCLICDIREAKEVAMTSYPMLKQLPRKSFLLSSL